MSEIAHTRQPFTATLETLPPATRRDDQFDRMGRWLELLMRSEQAAQVLARTAFVPEPMRGQPENIAAAMMTALELGIDPLDGLSNIHVVKGKIGFSAEFMRRRIVEAGHEYVIDESTATRCKIRGRRNGSNDWQTVVFTAEQAAKAKINLGDYPEDKLVARASSRLCRRVFPDVLGGRAIVDDLDEDDTVTDNGAPVQRKRQPRAVKAVAPTPPPPTGAADDLLDEPAEAAQPVTVTVTTDNLDLADDTPDEPPTKAMNNKMHALFREAGVDDRDDRLTVTSAILGYPITSSSGITKPEGFTLIDALESWRVAGRTEEKVREILNNAALAEQPTLDAESDQ